MPGNLQQEHTLDIVDELVRRMASAGHSGRIEIDHNGKQQAVLVRGMGAYTRSGLAHFDPPQLRAVE